MIDFFIEGKEQPLTPDPFPARGKGVVTLVRYRGIVYINVSFYLRLDWKYYLKSSPLGGMEGASIDWNYYLLPSPERGKGWG